MSAEEQTDARMSKQSGFTFIEVMIVLAMLAPLLVALASTSARVNDAVETSTRSAEVASSLQRATRQLSDFLRPAKLSTMRATAVQADVAATPPRAAAVGQWIGPTDLVWRPGLEFKTARGLLAMNNALSTAVRRVTFVLQPGELPNGMDDDGDGLVDEGRIEMQHDATVVAAISDIEACGFQLDGRMISVRLRGATRGTDGKVYRAYIERQFYLRNN